MFLKRSGCGGDICKKKCKIFGFLGHNVLLDMSKLLAQKMKDSSCPDLRLDILQLKIR